MIMPLSARKPRKKCAICKYWEGEKPDIPLLGTYLVEKENEGNCGCVQSGNYNCACGAMQECENFELDDRYCQENIIEYKKQQTHLHIPACVDSVGKIEEDFKTFLSLEEITVDSNNKNYVSIDGVLFSKDKKVLLHYPAMKKDEEYVIPEGVEKICFEFSYPNLKKLRFPKSLKEFAYCQGDELFSFLGYIELDVLDIGENVNMCKEIDSFTSPYYMVKEFCVDEKNEAFCAVDGVVYTKDMKTLLMYPSLKEDTTFEIPEQVEKIMGCIINENLKEVTLSKNCTNLDDKVFFHCENLEKINIPDDHCYEWPEDSFKKGFVLDI